MDSLETTRNTYPREVAEQTAAFLQEFDGEWNYKAVHLEDGMSVIEMWDGNGNYMGMA